MEEIVYLDQDHQYAYRTINCDQPNAEIGNSSVCTILSNSSIATEIKADFKWSVNQTKELLDLYKLYKSKVGTMEIKTMKQLWIKIALVLRKKHNMNVTDANCLNRWKVIERNYKKYIENENATGRGRKYFEYTQEMEDIMGKRKSIRPELLLSSDTVHHIESIATDNNEITSHPSSLRPDEKAMEESLNSEKECKKVKSLQLKTQANTRRRSYLELMRADRKKFNEDKLAIEKEKLTELKRKNTLIEKRNKIIKENKCQILAELKRKNNLMEEQNNILRENKVTPNAN